ncbi:uncharacterized protein TNCV_3369541 [Trichonephila clavipes]|uniref:Uncharacterized protein n=1 Tax=Trichonephila clavipes TaxID=2585209 RepID=A0A8X6R4G8_TRICX|nr:uncharacterized protein TNCV_3369541 [Trichonephila clavipes]
MTAHRYVHYILQPRVATHATAPRSHFSTRQCSASHGKGITRLSLQCYYSSLACPILKFVSIRAYLGSFGASVGHVTSLNPFEARLQQIWNEMSQDIIQNLYASMPYRIAWYIRARGGSTGTWEVERGQCYDLVRFLCQTIFENLNITEADCKEPLPAPGNRSNERRYKEKDLTRTEEKRSERDVPLVASESQSYRPEDSYVSENSSESEDQSDGDSEYRIVKLYERVYSDISDASSESNGADNETGVSRVYHNEIHEVPAVEVHRQMLRHLAIQGSKVSDPLRLLHQKHWNRAASKRFLPAVVHLFQLWAPVQLLHWKYWNRAASKRLPPSGVYSVQDLY